MDLTVLRTSRSEEGVDGVLIEAHLRGLYPVNMLDIIEEEGENHVRRFSLLPDSGSGTTWLELE